MTIATQTVYHSTTFVLIRCYKCAIPIGLPEDLYHAAKRDHSITWYCAHGHGQVFTGQTEEERLNAQLEATRNALASWRADAARSERRRYALKGQMTKLRKRIAAGVCPECSRTFQNLATHMQKQHPDFTPELAE